MACVVIGCGRIRSKCNVINFFTLKREWAEYLTELQVLNYSKAVQKYICSVHFESNTLKVEENRTLPTKEAWPILNLEVKVEVRTKTIEAPEEDYTAVMLPRITPKDSSFWPKKAKVEVAGFAIEICRICLEGNFDEPLESIFDSQKLNHLKDCFPEYQIYENDGFPKHLLELLDRNGSCGRI